jgi:Endonuclease NucS
MRVTYDYAGRLAATLAEATRLLVFKADGSVLGRCGEPARRGSPDRVAVCTDARWITGQVIDSEGGFRRWAS